jgi:hypothetical protein
MSERGDAEGLNPRTRASRNWSSVNYLAVC